MMALFNLDHDGGLRCPKCGGGWCQKWALKTRRVRLAFTFAVTLACMEYAIIGVAYYCHQ